MKLCLLGPGPNGTTSAAATAVAKPVVEARSPVIAKYSATTESVFAESSGDAGSSGPGVKDTTIAAATTVATSVLDKRGLLGLRGTRPPQNPISQCLLVNFPLKLVKLGLLGLRCTAPTSVSQSEVEESSDEASSFGALEAVSSWPRASCTTSKAAKAAVAKTSLLLVAAVHETGPPDHTGGTRTTPGS